MSDYLEITSRTSFEEIPDEVKRAVDDIVDGWYQAIRVDWEDVWDRLDGMVLDDGRVVSVETLAGPAIDGLKAYALKMNARNR
jgi:hypothetical protein